MPDDPRSLRRLGGGRWQTRDERFTIESSWALARGRRGDDRRAGSVARARTVRVACRRARCHRGDPCGACGDVAAGRPAAGGTRSPAAPGRREQVPAPPRTATTKVRPPEPGKPEEPEEPDWIADLPPRNAAGRGASRRSRGPRPGRRGRSRPRRSRGWSAGHRRALLRQRVAGSVAAALEAGRGRLDAVGAADLADKILEAAAGVEPSGDLPGWRLIELETGGRAGRPIEPHDR